MIIKVKIKTVRKSKERIIIVWVQKHKDFINEMQEIFKFFDGQIKFKTKSRLLEYFKITSENPAIMLSLLSTIQELIPEIYFNREESVEMKEKINL
jgi:uncharacterized protein YeaC (DUF1315 family)